MYLLLENEDDVVKERHLEFVWTKCGWSTDMHLEPEKIWRGNENPLINSVSLPFWKFKALLTFKAFKFVPFSTYEMKTTSKYNQRWNSFTYYYKIVNCVVIRWLSFITLMQIPFVCFFQYLNIRRLANMKKDEQSPLCVILFHQLRFYVSFSLSSV